MTQLTVAAYQGSVFTSDLDRAVEHLAGIAQSAEQQCVDVLCMPEGYLGGYFASRDEAERVALDLSSKEFQKVLDRLSSYSTTLVIGLNEKDKGSLYNTAVIVEEGKLVGRYRKACLYHPYFTPGRDFPIFRKKGIPYGVLICLDLTRFEPARILAQQGARILFAPMCNRVAKDATFPRVGQQFSHLIARSYENQVVIVTSDIIWEDAQEHCPGFASIYDENGIELQRGEPFTEGLLVESISLSSLRGERKRLHPLCTSVQQAS